MAAYTKTVRTKCGIVSNIRGATPFLLSGLCDHVPGNFWRWPSGSLYFTNGLNKPHRWNGYRNSFVPVGLTAPSGTPALAGSGSGSMLGGSYQVYVRFVDEDGMYSPLSTASAVTTVAASVAQINFSSLPVPTDQPRVVARQILRNTDGQYTTFYVDVETTDLWSASGFSSTQSDTLLAAQEAVPLFDQDGKSLTDQWTPPRDDKPILAHHRGRMFAAGEVVYSRGNAQVTFGSTTVTGTDTAWTPQMVNREFLVLGLRSPKAYTISAVSGQTLTLSAPYRGATDLFASYAIRPPVGQRNTVYYSNPDEPDQWPSVNALTLEEAGDAITALIPASSFIYVGLFDALYKFSFDSDPAQDGSFFRVSSRGSVNQRSWARVNETFYVLDHQGVYRNDVYGNMEEVADSIRDLWQKEAQGEFKIDWTYQQYFHCALDREDTTVRFYVSLSGPTMPRHALCFNYTTSEWTIEEFPFPVTSSTYQTKHLPRLFCGGRGMKLYEQGVGTVDGPSPSGYQTYGTVTSSGPVTFTDAGLRLPSSGVNGSPVVITGGRGKGQVRLIDTVSGTTVYVTQPWSVTPDTTSTYQVGGIPWRFKTGWYRYATASQRQPIETFFKPVSRGTMDLRLYADSSEVASTWGLDRPAQGDDDGMSYEKPVLGYPDSGKDLHVSLTRSVGYVRSFLDTPQDAMLRRGNTVALEVKGTAGPEGVFLYSVSIGGAG